MNTSLLVFNDDLESGNSLKRRLAGEGYQVQLSSGPEGNPLLLDHLPDLVILDVTIPNADGIEVCQTIRHLNYCGPILMLSVHNSVADRVAGLDAGADDYLGIPFDISELLARVRALLRRYVREVSVTQFSDLELDKGLHEVRRHGRTIYLNRIEFDLLALFMTRPQHVLSRDTIMDLIWGAQLGGYGNSLDVYMSRLRRKLGKPPLIHTIRSIGYILKEAVP